MQRTYVVTGVCCSTEERVLRKALDDAVGTGHYSFSVVTADLGVDESVEEAALLRAIRLAGCAARRKSVAPVEESFWRRHRGAVLVGVAGALALGGVMLAAFTGTTLTTRALLGSSMLVGGWPIARKAWGALRNRVLDTNVLMTVAVIGAVAIDRWSEGAAVIILFSVALMLESYSATRTRRAVQSLMSLSSDQAAVVRNGVELLLPPEQVEPGDIILVRPGERIPVDGVVTQGTSMVNQATITGEATPVPIMPGAQVYAGTLNDRGALQVRATRRYEETTLAHIIHLVAEAEHKRAPVQNFVDRFAALYTPVVLVLALIVALVPPLVFGAPFQEWLYRALVMLVISCPCALVISTPVTLVSALTNAARRGILIKGGKTLELLSKVRAVAFDKTGTLTEGTPRVTDILPLNGMSPDALLRMVAALEQKSEHHLASAVLGEASRRGMGSQDLCVEAFEAIPGRGVRGTLEGKPLFLGNHELCEEERCCSPQVEQVLARLSQEGKTVVILGTPGEALGIIAMSDGVRNQAKEALTNLQAMGFEHTVMLSGDSADAAGQIARGLGLSEWIGGLLPEEKMTAVQELRRRYHHVAMVGDGINDAPALAASTVGIAMGGVGSDTALETADVVLMSDNLLRLPHLFALSRSTLRIIKQNVGLAVALKAVFLVLSGLGVATLWMAVLADDGAALLVILNGLRALSFERKSMV